MYSKTKPRGKKFFNSSNIELVRVCKELPSLALPLENEYKVVETYAMNRDGEQYNSPNQVNMIVWVLRKIVNTCQISKKF